MDEIKKEDFIDTIKGYHKRDCIEEIKNYIENKEDDTGIVLLLYGLRRTGKTVLLEQTAADYAPSEWALYNLDESDTMMDIKEKIKEDRKNGKYIIMLDEITNETQL